MDNINLRLSKEFYRIVVLKKGISKNLDIGLRVIVSKSESYVYYILCSFCVMRSIYSFLVAYYIVHDISISSWIFMLHMH